MDQSTDELEKFGHTSIYSLETLTNFHGYLANGWLVVWLGLLSNHQSKAVNQWLIGGFNTQPKKKLVNMGSSSSLAPPPSGGGVWRWLAFGAAALGGIGTVAMRFPFVAGVILGLSSCSAANQPCADLAVKTWDKGSTNWSILTERCDLYL